MSAESAKAFIKRVMTDKEFAAQVVKLEGDEARQKFAQDAGYDFTPDDVQTLLPAGLTVDQLRHLDKGDELPDEVMEAVVGGKTNAEQFGVDLAINVAVELVVAVAAAAI